VLTMVRCCVTSHSLQFEANEEDYCQKALCCTCPHTAAHTVETLKKLNFEVFEHFPYSPDLASMDSHLFGPLKQAMDHGPASEGNGACVACLWAQKFFLWGQKEDCAAMDKVHWKQGEYVEKWCTISTLVLINVKHTLQLIIDSALYNGFRMSKDE
jgi:hypothetical protein